MATTKTGAADLIARATAVGIDIDAAITATSQKAPSLDNCVIRVEKRTEENVARWITAARIDCVALFNRSQRDALEAQIAKREAAADRSVQSVADVPMATVKQVDYILQLRARRVRSGEGGGFVTYDGDPAMLTSREASAYIDSLRGEY